MSNQARAFSASLDEHALLEEARMSERQRVEDLDKVRI